MYKYFPHTEADISEMLGKIGLSSLDELYAEIPENIRFDKDYDLKKSMSEDEVTFGQKQPCRTPGVIPLS